MHDGSVTVLCSGSSGNSILVSHADSRILIDAGLSCRELERRLSLFGITPAQIDAVMLTHEHTDHTRGVNRFCSENDIPVYATRGTLALTPLDGLRTKTIAAGRSFSVGSINMHPFKVRHLAAEPVAFSIILDSKKVGIASDLGCVTPNVIDEMTGSDLMLIEANYDEGMLLAGNYPEFLKRAINSDHGHLSNDDAATLSLRATSERTANVVLVHLSKDNNTPDKARNAVEHKLEQSKYRPKIDVTEHGSASGPFRLG